MIHNTRSSRRLFFFVIIILNLFSAGGGISCAADAAQGLWVPSWFEFSEFQGAAILKSGVAKATLTGSDGSHGGTGITFDQSNNAWLTVCDVDNVIGGSAIIELTPTELFKLSKGKNVKASVVLSNYGPEPSLYCPDGLQFDAEGNLWLTSSDVDENPSILEYARNQLHTGSPLPAITITSPEFVGPGDIEFDRSGNLWITDKGAYTPSQAIRGAIFELTAEQLTASASVTPYLTLLSTSSSSAPPVTLSGAGAITFDSAGDLWAAYSNGYDNTNAGTVVMFSPDQLNASGTISPTPAITLMRNKADDVQNYNIYGPQGLSFDSTGDLWVANGSDTIVEFPPDQLANGNASPVPAITLIGTLAKPSKKPQKLNFYNPGLIRFGPLVQKWFD